MSLRRIRKSSRHAAVASPADRREHVDHHDLRNAKRADEAQRHHRPAQILSNLELRR
jgi:hypothetical protein